MKAKLTSLQILRAIAASMVVFYHFSLEGSRYSHGCSWIVSSGVGELGEAGVDLFFVLSGFIMFYTAGKLEGVAAAVQFLRKRALRIYPLYWVWTTVLFVLWEKHLALASHAYENDFLLKSYLLIPAFSGENLHPFLNQGWTLSYELLFYLLFTIAVVAGLGRRRVLVLIAIIFLSFGAGFLFSRLSVAREILTNSIVFEFAFGALAGAVCLKLYEAMDAEVRHVLAWTCLCFGAMLFVASVVFHGAPVGRLLRFGVPSFFVVLGAALWKERVYKPYLVFLGDASYSIYLTHGIGVMAFSSVLKRGVLQSVPLDLLIAGGTLVLVPLCALGYIVVERPMLRAMQLSGKRQKVLQEPRAVVRSAIS